MRFCFKQSHWKERDPIRQKKGPGPVLIPLSISGSSASRKKVLQSAGIFDAITLNNPPLAVKTLHWDAINPITGKPFTWGDPNLRWGSPSYYLDPGDEGFVPYDVPAPKPVAPKKKPFRRKAASNTHETINTNTTMPTFQYHTAPNPKGGFTTRPVLGQPVTDETFFNIAAAKSGGLTPDQLKTGLSAVLDTILECSSGCAFSTGLLGKLRFRPTSGGSQPGPADFKNPDEMNCDVALSITAEARDAWRAALTLESMGEVGKVSPEIDSILSQENDAPGKYTPGTMIELSGDRLDLDKSDVTQGVFFRSGSNAEVRATVYGTITPTSLSVLVPATLSGPLMVRVANHINGSVRSFTYMDAITPIA